MRTHTHTMPKLLHRLLTWDVKIYSYSLNFPNFQLTGMDSGVLIQDLISALNVDDSSNTQVDQDGIAG